MVLEIEINQSVRRKSVSKKYGWDSNPQHSACSLDGYCNTTMYMRELGHITMNIVHVLITV